ncbi:thyrotroph embryonic factor isoform X4 [Cephus cinctus]|uniref:Thyrotroph embryonic factor isoform X4 n=1 Tax=Cephus cinctus TaxID=211228 RepID=A0AAJ7RKL4_CEPCN|nr:thyrotroph embryonic factor isoform X4 [Cephus cinctus]
MGSEEGSGMAPITDPGASWQHHYVWPNPHPHHGHHPQYQQSLQMTATSLTNSQQHQLQLPSVQPTPSHQQHQYHQQQQHHHHHHHHHPRGQMTSRRPSSYGSPGKQGKDGPEEKKDADGELWGNVEAQAAFLGPNLWDKTLPYDADLKVLNHYVDLDEFLSENGIPVDGVAGGGQGTMQGGQLHKMNNNDAGGHQGPAGLHLEPVTKRERSPSPSECCSPDTLNPPSPADSNSEDSSRIQYGLSLVALSMASSGRDFDPRTRAFSDEELKPQPMIKKSRKQVPQFVPDDLKDDKYWARRRKNNMAAKRSRDARRMKENQIALRAGFLEKEVRNYMRNQDPLLLGYANTDQYTLQYNMGLRQELDRLKNENMLLRDKLSKYTDV